MELYDLRREIFGAHLKCMKESYEVFNFNLREIAKRDPGYNSVERDIAENLECYSAFVEFRRKEASELELSIRRIDIITLNFNRMIDAKWLLIYDQIEESSDIITSESDDECVRELLEKDAMSHLEKIENSTSAIDSLKVFIEDYWKLNDIIINFDTYASKTEVVV